MAGLAVGMNACAYDAVKLDSKVTNILNFAQTIGQDQAAANQKVAQWLNKDLTNKDGFRHFNDAEVIEIARIVESNATINAKVANLVTIIANNQATALKHAEEKAQHIAEQAKQTDEYINNEYKRNSARAEMERKSAAIAGGMLGALAMIIAYQLAQDLNVDITNYIRKIVSEMNPKTIPSKKWFS